MLPSLDHYVGRGVQAVVKGEEDWDWAVRLEGGVLIRNKDKRRTKAPEGLDGLALMMTIFSEMDTVMKFGRGQTTETQVLKDVTLMPTKYTIAGPGIEEEIYPQWPEELPKEKDEMEAPQVYTDEYLAEREQEPVEGSPESASNGSEGAEVEEEAS